MSEVKVGWEGHRLGVDVKPERSRYGVRETANVAIAVTDPDGRPASSADVAFVAVDEALLQLKPNQSWDVLKAMMGERSLEVATSTAQMQVVGKRHYGKKAVAAGGGGGDASAVNRQNFQPVLLWKGKVALDGQGRATVPVPLSDALSSFKLVAIATQGAQLFGTGQADLRTAQDLSAYPGLPPLVRTGDRFDAVYPIRLGFFKTRVTSDDGREQVTGFPMPGDILGFDAISAGNFQCDALALEDAEVCVVPFDKLETLTREFNALQRQFHRVLSREIVRDQGVMMLLGTMRAEQRIATFVLNLSQRFSQRGFSPREFILRMTREEIGNYLGLVVETVSRLFTRLAHDGVIAVKNKEVHILDFHALCTRCGETDEHDPSSHQRRYAGG